MSLLEAKTGSRKPHVAKTLFFAMNFNHFLPIRWSSWSRLEAIWSPLGPSSGQLGALLGRLGTIWSHLEASRNNLGGRLSLLEAKTSSSRPHVAKTLFFARNFNVFLVPLGAFLELSWAWCDGAGGMCGPPKRQLG